MWLVDLTRYACAHRWDETPASQRHGGGATPIVGGATPSFSTPSVGGGGATPNFGVTPAGALAMGMATPSPMAAGAMTPEQMQSWRWEKELDERNRPLSDEELDALFPQEGYKVRDGVSKCTNSTLFLKRNN